MTLNFSSQQIAGYASGDMQIEVGSIGSDVVATQMHKPRGAMIAYSSFCVSGKAEAMEEYARFLRRFADEIALECERVIGREREEMNREMEQAERDQIEAHNDARAQGY